MKRRPFSFLLAALPCLGFAADIEHRGGFVSMAGYSALGRYEILDAIVPHGGGIVSSANGEILISLNDVFSLYASGVVLDPINVDSIRVQFAWLPDGALYVELDEADWTLVFSEDLTPSSWTEVALGERFQVEGKGWRIEKSKLQSSLFLRARLK